MGAFTTGAALAGRAATVGGAIAVAAGSLGVGVEPWVPNTTAATMPSAATIMASKSQTEPPRRPRGRARVGDAGIEPRLGAGAEP